MLSLGLLFSVIALMDPLYGEENVKIKREGIDIVYALDLSNSMYSEDVAPNRLEKAKKLILESTQRLAGDRIGLMVFALDAYSISPLTHDYNSIQAYINIASPELITHQGTNFSAIIKSECKISVCHHSNLLDFSLECFFIKMIHIKGFSATALQNTFIKIHTRTGNSMFLLCPTDPDCLRLSLFASCKISPTRSAFDFFTETIRWIQQRVPSFAFFLYLFVCVPA